MYLLRTGPANVVAYLIYFDINRNIKMKTSVCPLPVEVAASAFAALGSEQRLSLLRTLVRVGSGGLTIGELGRRTGVSGSTLTHHMRILTQAGLVAQAKRGRSVICAAADFGEVRALSEYLLSECCTECAQPEGAHG